MKKKFNLSFSLVTYIFLFATLMFLASCGPSHKSDTEDRVASDTTYQEKDAESDSLSKEDAEPVPEMEVTEEQSDKDNQKSN